MLLRTSNRKEKLIRQIADLEKKEAHIKAGTGERASSSTRQANESELRHLFGEEGKAFEEDDFVVPPQDQVYKTLAARRRQQMLEKKTASAAARQEEPSDEDFTKAGANTLHKTSTDIRNRKQLLDKLDSVPEQRAFIQKPVKLEPKDEVKKEPKSEVKEERRNPR